MMNKEIVISKSMSKSVWKNVEDYAKFVSQVLHDETFLVELDKKIGRAHV